MNKPFIKYADAAAEFSKDPSSKVGAVIISPDGETVSTGYNGMVAECDESMLSYERPEKYFYMIHAEMNALFFAKKESLRGCTLYVTHGPCIDCLKHVLQKKIRKIVYRDCSIVRDRGGDDQKMAIKKLIEATNAVVISTEGVPYTVELGV